MFFYDKMAISLNSSCYPSCFEDDFSEKRDYLKKAINPETKIPQSYFLVNKALINRKSGNKNVSKSHIVYSNSRRITVVIFTIFCLNIVKKWRFWVKKYFILPFFACYCYIFNIRRITAVIFGIFCLQCCQKNTFLRSNSPLFCLVKSHLFN